jgi:hypothetical protein
LARAVDRTALEEHRLGTALAGGGGMVFYTTHF